MSKSVRTAPPWLEREHQFFISRAPHRLPNLVVSYHEVAMAFETNETISKKHSTTSLPTNHYQSPTIKVTAAVAVASSPQLS